MQGMLAQRMAAVISMLQSSPTHSMAKAESRVIALYTMRSET
jgi:hypothetical protein